VLAYPWVVLILANTVSDAFEPVVAWLERRMRRGWAAVIAYAALYGVLVGLGFIVVPRLVEQAQEMTARIPQLMRRLEDLTS
jgi:predicted PurR-regulated permease PerM